MSKKIKGCLYANARNSLFISILTDFFKKLKTF